MDGAHYISVKLSDYRVCTYEELKRFGEFSTKLRVDCRFFGVLVRTGLVTVVVICALLSFPLGASPLIESEHTLSGSLTRLLEYLSEKNSTSVIYHLACLTSTGEYGLEFEASEDVKYCQYLGDNDQEMFSETFSLLFSDEDAIGVQVEEFLQENKKRSAGYWKYENNYLYYFYRRGKGKTHFLLPRNAMEDSGSESGSIDLESDDRGDNNTEIDVGGYALGVSVILIGVSIGIVALIIACKDDILELIRKKPLNVQY